MRKVIRGKSFEVTLKTKISISFLLARSLSLIARINALQQLARIKDIWSDKEQRSLREKLFVSRLLQTWARADCAAGATWWPPATRWTFITAAHNVCFWHIADISTRSTNVRFFKGDIHCRHFRPFRCATLSREEQDHAAE